MTVPLTGVVLPKLPLFFYLWQTLSRWKAFADNAGFILPLRIASDIIL